MLAGATTSIRFTVALQGLAAQSTMEAELVAAALTIEDAVFSSNMMLELDFDESFGSVPLHIDNTSALHVAPATVPTVLAQNTSCRGIF